MGEEVQFILFPQIQTKIAKRGCPILGHPLIFSLNVSRFDLRCSKIINYFFEQNSKQFELVDLLLCCILVYPNSFQISALLLILIVEGLIIISFTLKGLHTALAINLIALHILLEVSFSSIFLPMPFQQFLQGFINFNILRNIDYISVKFNKNLYYQKKLKIKYKNKRYKKSLAKFAYLW